MMVSHRFYVLMTVQLKPSSIKYRFNIQESSNGSEGQTAGAIRQRPIADGISQVYLLIEMLETGLTRLIFCRKFMQKFIKVRATK